MKWLRRFGVSFVVVWVVMIALGHRLYGQTNSPYSLVQIGTTFRLLWAYPFEVFSAVRMNNIRFADGFASVQAAVNDLNNQSGKVMLTSPYTSATQIKCASTAFTISQMIEGLSNGDTGGTTVTFTGATNGFSNCELSNVNVQTSNSGGQVGVFQSGLHQELRNVHISTTGTGKWKTGIQQFGSVTNAVTYVECETGAAAICLDVVPNGGNQTGALTILGGEFRATTTCIHLNNLLSGSMIGGAIEGCGTNGLLADTNSSDFSEYGTHYETNTTNDISWQTGGQLALTDVQFPGGTANNFNCPNTSCTVLLKIEGAHGSLHSNWIFGNSILAGSFFGMSQISGSGSLINNAGGKLTLLAITTRDGTTVNNVIGYNNGNGVSRVDLIPKSGGTTFTIQSDNSGSASLTNNGVTFLTSKGTPAMFPGSTSFASLGTSANGAVVFCSDCTIANPCASGGTGALAKRLNSIWVCN